MTVETTQFVHPQTGEVLAPSSAAGASTTRVSKRKETKIVDAVETKIDAVEAELKADGTSVVDKVEAEIEKVVDEVETEAKSLASKVTGFFKKDAPVAEVAAA